MRRIWRLRPSRSTKRSWSSFCHDTRAGLSFTPSSSRPCCRQLHALVVERAFDAHQVFLLDLRVAADQALGDAAILREHDEPGGVDVQAAGGREAAQVRGLELRVGDGSSAQRFSGLMSTIAGSWPSSGWPET